MFPYTPDYAVSPGQILHDYLFTLNYSTLHAAQDMNLPETTVLGILCGQEKVTEDIAIKLEKFTELHRSIWLGIEEDYSGRLQSG